MKPFIFLGVLAILLASCFSDTQSESGFSQFHLVEPSAAIVARNDFLLNQEGAYVFEISTQNPPPNPIDPNAYQLLLSYEILVDGRKLRKEELSDLGSPWWGVGKAGFILEWLHAPEDLPKKSKLSITYELIVDEKFISFFGNEVGVGIRKISDK